MYGLLFIYFFTFLLVVVNYIMAGCAFVDAKEVFIIETAVFWHWDDGYMTKSNPFYVNSALSKVIYNRILILITWNWDILNRAIFSRNVHWWANKARSWLLRTLTFALFEFINLFANDYPCHYIIHTQHDCPSQMNSNLLISVAKLTRSNFRSYVRDNHAGSV